MISKYVHPLPPLAPRTEAVFHYRRPVARDFLNPGKLYFKTIYANIIILSNMNNGIHIVSLRSLLSFEQCQQCLYGGISLTVTYKIYMYI